MNTIQDLFKVDGGFGQLPVPVRSDPHPEVPELDSLYHFEDANRVMDYIAFLAGKTAKKNLWLNGPTGAGKSSFVRQVSARLVIPTFELGCHNGTELGEILGRIEPTAEGLAWVDGPMLSAMRCGGVVLLDEWDQVHPTIAMGCNKVLDSRRYVIPSSGEVVVAHPFFRVVVTGNSSGGGDDTGHYRAVQTQNAAQRQRWAYMHIGYMPHEQEKTLLKTITEKDSEGAMRSVADEVIDAMLSLADATRKLFAGELVGNESTPIGVVISTRTLRDWVGDTLRRRFLPGGESSDYIYKALCWNLLDGCDSQDREVIDGLWKRLFGSNS